MNTIEKLHLESIEKNNWGETEFAGLHTFENSKSFTEINGEVVASKLAKITEEISVEFLEWYKNRFVQIYDKSTKTHTVYFDKEPVKFTTSELFKEFVKSRSL